MSINLMIFENTGGLLAVGSKFTNDIAYTINSDVLYLIHWQSFIFIFTSLQLSSG